MRSVYPPPGSDNPGGSAPSNILMGPIVEYRTCVRRTGIGAKVLPIEDVELPATDKAVFHERKSHAPLLRVTQPSSEGDPTHGYRRYRRDFRNSLSARVYLRFADGTLRSALKKGSSAMFFKASYPPNSLYRSCHSPVFR